MSEIRYGGGGVPYIGPNAEPKEEVVEEKQQCCNPLPSACIKGVIIPAARNKSLVLTL